MSTQALVWVLLAASFNVPGVLLLKASRGMAACWPTLGMLLLIIATHYCLGQALESGGRIGLAIGLNVVLVVGGSTLVGYLVYGESMSFWQLSGLALATAGMLLALAGQGHRQD